MQLTLPINTTPENTALNTCLLQSFTIHFEVFIQTRKLTNYSNKKKRVFSLRLFIAILYYFPCRPSSTAITWVCKNSLTMNHLKSSQQ